MTKDDTASHLYPKFNDKAFNSNIANRTEFKEHKLNGKIHAVEEHAEELCSDTFELAPHQQFVRNFLSFNTPYNSLLLFHGVGTGKTCSSILVCEEMRRYMKQINFNKRIIIVASANVQENFRLQLFDERRLRKTNDGLWYMTGCVGNSIIEEINPTKIKNIPEKTIIGQIKRVIENNYVFMGYTQFANYLEKKGKVSGEMSNTAAQQTRTRKLNATFAGRLLVIDEVHNLRMEDDNKNKRASKALMELVENVKNTRLVLLSATPMFNSHTEIVRLLNIMNVNDGRSKVNNREIFDIKSGNLKVDENGIEIGKELLQQKATGYVSFLKGENPYTFPYRVWPSLFNKKASLLGKQYPGVAFNGKEILKPIQHLDLFMVTLGEEQNKTYKQIIEKIKKDDDFEEKEKFGYTLLRKPIEALNISYPNDGTDQLTGIEGLERVMTYEKEGAAPYGRYNYTYRPEILKKYGNIFSPELIGKYSSKIKHICESVKKDQGIVMVYSQYLEGGLVPVALALEEIGFKKFGTKQLFRGTKKPTRFKYAMITGDKSLSPDNANTINALTSENNSGGDEIKVILLSRAGSEGIDLKNVRAVHVMEPWYNMNRIEQVIGRAVRTCSHKTLLHKERNVLLYLYGSRLPDDEDKEAIDLFVYRRAEMKAIQIGYVTRILKEASVDCLINYEQNNYIASNFKQNVMISLANGEEVLYHIGDKPFSVNCDYMESCSHECILTSDSIEENSSTYNEDYAGANNERIIERIQQLFMENYFYHKKDLIKNVNVKHFYPKTQIFSALTKMINNKITLKDRFQRYGYMVNVGDYYLFQPEELMNKYISGFERNVPLSYKPPYVSLEGLVHSSDNDDGFEESKADAEPVQEVLVKLRKQYEIVLSEERPSTETKKNPENHWLLSCNEVYRTYILPGMSDLDVNIEEQVIGHLIDMLKTNDKVILYNHWLSSTSERSTFDGLLEKKMKESVMDVKNTKGVLVADSETNVLMIYSGKDKKLNKAEYTEREAFKEAIKKRTPDQKKFSDIMGIMVVHKDAAMNETIVFKSKESSMPNKHNTGARCDQANKQTVSRLLNKILDTNRFGTEVPETKLKKDMMCCYMELLLRQRDRMNVSGKRWFLNLEENNLVKN